jgi:hypothetical protein
MSHVLALLRRFVIRRAGNQCEYCQLLHVYTSLPGKLTVLEYLQKQAAFGKKDPEILEVAGSLLFRKKHTRLVGFDRLRSAAF